MDDMSATKKRKVHTAEFKAKVGLKALGGTKTVNEIAQELGVNPGLIHQWKKDIVEQAKTLFEGKRGPKALMTSDEETTERLYGQIGRLKVELDWLKKSQGSACHSSSKLGGQRWRGAAEPAVRVGGCMPSDGFRKAGSQNHAQ